MEPQRCDVARKLSGCQYVVASGRWVCRDLSDLADLSEVGSADVEVERAMGAEGFVQTHPEYMEVFVSATTAGCRYVGFPLRVQNVMIGVLCCAASTELDEQQREVFEKSAERAVAILATQLAMEE